MRQSNQKWRRVKGRFLTSSSLPNRDLVWISAATNTPQSFFSTPKVSKYWPGILFSLQLQVLLNTLDFSFNANTMESEDTCLNGYEELLEKLGPQSFLQRGLYLLRPALYLYIGETNWAEGRPYNELHRAKHAFVESGHPAYAEQV